MEVHASKMAKQWRTAADLQYMHVEKNDLPSKTQEGQAMSAREIINRYTTGQSMNIIAHTPEYWENVPHYDTRMKDNIQIAMDRHETERQIDELTKQGIESKRQMARMAKSSQEDEKRRLQLGQPSKEVRPDGTDNNGLQRPTQGDNPA